MEELEGAEDVETVVVGAEVVGALAVLANETSGVELWGKELVEGETLGDEAATRCLPVVVDWVAEGAIDVVGKSAGDVANNEVVGTDPSENVNSPKAEAEMVIGNSAPVDCQRVWE